MAWHFQESMNASWCWYWQGVARHGTQGKFARFLPPFCLGQGDLRCCWRFVGPPGGVPTSTSFALLLSNRACAHSIGHAFNCPSPPRVGGGLSFYHFHSSCHMRALPANMHSQLARYNLCITRHFDFQVSLPCLWPLDLCSFTRPCNMLSLKKFSMNTILLFLFLKPQP